MTRDGRRLLEHFSFGKCEQLGGFHRGLKKNLKNDRTNGEVVSLSENEGDNP
jgi:hypothetical protein